LGSSAYIVVVQADTVTKYQQGYNIKGSLTLEVRSAQPWSLSSLSLSFVPQKPSASVQCVLLLLTLSSEE